MRLRVHPVALGDGESFEIRDAVDPMQQVCCRSLASWPAPSGPTCSTPAAVAEHHRSPLVRRRRLSPPHSESRFSLLSAQCAEDDWRIDQPQSLGFDDAGQSPHEVEAVRAGHHDELPGFSVRSPRSSATISIWSSGAQGTPQKMSALSTISDNADIGLAPPAGRGRKSFLVDVVGDDVEATGDHGGRNIGSPMSPTPMIPIIWPPFSECNLALWGLALSANGITIGAL